MRCCTGGWTWAGPLETACLLARAWPGARLEVVDDSGHTGNPTMRERILTAPDDFARD